MAMMANVDELRDRLLAFSAERNLDYIHIDTVIDIIDDSDVVEVVRCKDCKHYQCCGNNAHGLCFDPKRKDGGTHEVYEDDFCSYGERRR